MKTLNPTPGRLYAILLKDMQRVAVARFVKTTRDAAGEPAYVFDFFESKVTKGGCLTLRPQHVLAMEETWLHWPLEVAAAPRGTADVEDVRRPGE